MSIAQLIRSFSAQPTLPLYLTPIQTYNDPNAHGTSADDYFGEAVAISGNYAVIGARYEGDAGGAYSGKVYIFDVTTGSLLHILNNPSAYSPSGDDHFGYSVSVDGNYAIVGTPLEDDAGTTSGKAYIFDVTTGSLLRTLDNPNAYSTSANDWFGISVAISGNLAVIGARHEGDTGGTNSGKAYSFDVTTGSLLRTLDNPNAYSTSANDNFGKAVAISGNRVVIGSHFEDDAGGTDSGKAYIFDATTGSLLHTLHNPNAYGTSASDIFGKAVAISGNRVVVSAHFEDDAGGYYSGKVYIFDATTGSLLHTLSNPNAYETSAYDYFGFSVAISGNRVVVGASYEDDAGGTGSGKAYVYQIS